MTEPQHDVPTAQDATPPATPVWVKALGVVLAVLLLLVALKLLLGGGLGGHGPGLHGG